MKKMKLAGLLILAVLFSNGIFAQSIETGKQYMYYEKYSSAKAEFAKVLAANPNNEDAVYWLGQAEMGLDNTKAAKELYLKKMNEKPNSPMILVGVGQIELKEGKTADARNHFETAINMSKGKSIDVLNAIGYANSIPLAKYGDANYAIAKLNQATQIKGFKDPSVYLNMGNAYRKLGDGGNASLAYQKAIQLNPNYAAAYFRYGGLYHSQGRSQEDLYMKWYNDAIAKDPKYAPVYATLMNYYYETDVNKSAEYLNKWLNNSDDDPKACYYRASMKYAQGLFNDAIAKADECISHGGEIVPNIYGLKALAYNRLGDSVKAKQYYEEYFAKQDPELIGGGDYANYATILMKFPGNEAKTAEMVNKAIETDTLEENKANYAKKMAVAYENVKNYSQAANWWGKVVKIKKNPTNLDLFYAGYNNYLAGHYDSSKPYFQRYIQVFPSDLLGYYMMGNAESALDSTGVNGAAVPYYQKLIELGEANPTAANAKTRLLVAYKYFMGYSWNVKKDKVAALAFADKALALDPTDTNVIKNREFMAKNTPK